MKVAEAEAQIARILMELEKEHNSYVEFLCIEHFDITKAEDAHSKFLRRVSIQLAPKPGMQWDV